MEFLTVKEFADRVKMCTHTVLKSIRQGKIYAMRVGVGKKSPYRISETEIERLQLMHKYEKSK